MEDESVGIETILVIPKRADRFQYKINDGKNHMCTEDSLRKLIMPHIDDNALLIFLDMLTRLRIFALIVDPKGKGEVIELKPKNTKDKQAKATVNAMMSHKKKLVKMRRKGKKTSEQRLDDSMDKMFERVL